MAIGYSEHEKRIAAASRAWRFLQWTLSDDFAEHEEDRRVVIADGEYTGRPAVPISEQQRRARKEYFELLESLRAYEKEQNIEALSDDAVKEFVEEKHGEKGRKRGGRALALQKYVRRIERQIGETKEALEEDFDDFGGRGRPKMSRKQKVKRFETLIEKARKELAAEYAAMSDRDKLWHQAHDLKSDRRQLRLALKSPRNPQSTRVWYELQSAEKIQEQLDTVCAQIARLDAKISMLDAGITIADDADQSAPGSLEEYRRTLEHMVKERKKIKALEEEALGLGIDIESLKRSN
jgi:hypothetical protein